MRRASVDYVLQLLGVEKILPSGENWVMTNCPLAAHRHTKGEDRKPSLAVSIGLGKSFVKCHACDVSGTMKTLIRECRKEGLVSEENAQQAYAKCSWVEKHEPQLPDDEEGVDDQPAALDPALLDQLSTYHKYFEKRGFSKREVMEWRLGATKLWHADLGDAAVAVLLPNVLPDGTVTHIQARFVKSKDFRWLPSGIHKLHVAGTHLFTGAEKRIVVCEGVFDAMRTRRALRKLKWLPESGGEYGVVALWGSKPNREQRQHLYSLIGTELILLVDNDAAGDLCADVLEEEGRKHVPRISRVRIPHVCKVCGKSEKKHRHADHDFSVIKDPDEAGSARLMRLLRKRGDLLTERLRAIIRPK